MVKNRKYLKYSMYFFEASVIMVFGTLLVGMLPKVSYTFFFACASTIPVFVLLGVILLLVYMFTAK